MQLPELVETGLANSSDMCRHCHLHVSYNAKAMCRLCDLDCSPQNWKIGEVHTGNFLGETQPFGLCFGCY